MSVYYSSYIRRCNCSCSCGMGNELSQHISHAQKTGVLQLKNFKLLKVRLWTKNLKIFIANASFSYSPKAPEEILQVSKTLRTLDLSSNRITSISLSIYQSLVNLKTLNLDNNRLGVCTQSLKDQYNLLTVCLLQSQYRTRYAIWSSLKTWIWTRTYSKTCRKQ